MMIKLTNAFKEKRKTAILFLAADLGHYIADAHMPLHTSVNHDGQLTNQKGIHALWETHIPDLFGEKYNYYTGEAKYIENIEKATWDMIKASHNLVASLLVADRKLRETYTIDKMYETDGKGNIARNKFNTIIHSKKYVTQYNAALNGMVENQLRKAILTTSNFWYTAWVNAGKPNLDEIDATELTNRNKKKLNKDLKLWREGKLFDLKSEKEFN